MTDSETQRPVAAASGRLQKTPILHLLVYALERKLTGTLELSAPGGETAAILFIDGLPSKVRTSEPVAYLGRVLLELGFVNEAMLNKTLLEISKTKRLHGQVLLAGGAISEAQLKEALRVQLERKLQRTFAFPGETAYAYFDGFDSLHKYGGDDVVVIDPLPLVWAAVREAPPWEHVHVALSRVASLPLRLSSKAELARFGFESKETQLLEVLRSRPMRIAELAATEILKPRQVQLLVYCLLITKQAQIIQDDGAFPPRLEHTPTAMPSPVRPSAPPPAPSTEQRNLMSFSLRAAVTTNPDGHRIETPRPPARSDSPRPPPPTNRPPPSQRLSPEAIAALSPELAERREQILDRGNTIDREDYFQMLDVSKDTDIDGVKRAFFALAKTWHPDRLPAQIADARDACSRVFSRMSEAHATLTDPERRARYMELLKGGGATPEAQATIAAVIEAATNFQKAEICLKRSDFAQAESLCRKACEADPMQPDYLALLAWLEAMKPEGQSKEATVSIILRLDKALSYSDKCERAYFYRGLLHKRIGNPQSAVRDFRRAAELNPRNIDAAREVRLFEMRRERGSAPPPAARGGAKATEPPKPGIFGKLFKK